MIFVILTNILVKNSLTLTKIFVKQKFDKKEKINL